MKPLRSVIVSFGFVLIPGRNFNFRKYTAIPFHKEALTLRIMRGFKSNENDNTH